MIETVTHHPVESGEDCLLYGLQDRPARMTQTYWAKGFDLTLQSDIPVTGAVPCAPEIIAEIRIAIGSVAPADDGAALSSHGTSLRIDATPTVRFLCTRDAVIVEPLANADPAKVSALLIANALPACLWLRGDPVLHASAMIPKGASRAIAVCGISGGGKSTILKAMLARGARAVADDTIRVVSANGTHIASGLPAAYWRKPSADADHRETFSVAPSQICARAALGAIFLLREGEERRFERLTGIARLSALLTQRHRPAMPEILGIEGALLPRFGSLAALDTYLWFRPPGQPELGEDELAFLEQAARKGNE